jgi:hypothetical protein
MQFPPRRSKIISRRRPRGRRHKGGRRDEEAEDMKETDQEVG